MIYDRKEVAQQTVGNLLAAGVITPALVPHTYGLLIKICDQDLTALLIESHRLKETEISLNMIGS